MFDRAIVYADESATAWKFVSGSEPFALGHYPGDPIYPGVLTLQLMLDLGDRLLANETALEPVRTRIVRTQYLGMVRPGDALEISATVKKRDAERLQVSARVSAAGVAKTRATLEYELRGK